MKIKLGFFVAAVLLFLGPGILLAQTTDLALGKPIVSVSSTATGSNPANAVDGNPATFWTSAGGGAQWLSVDLGTSVYIGRVVVLWGADSASSFDIEFSEDGLNYAPVWSAGGNFDNIINRQGRYVMVRTASGVNPNQYQLASLEVYAGTAPTSTPTPTTAPTSTPAPTPIPTPSGPTLTPQPGTTIGRYDVFETTLTYSTSSLTNPWEQVSVTAVFTSPSGKTLNIDGFYYDVDTYKVRFTPAEVGTYTYSGTITGPSGKQNFSGSLSSVASANKGFLRRQPGSPYKLQFDDGSFFIGSGFEDCWGLPLSGSNERLSGFIGESSSEPSGEGGEVDIDTYFQKYGNEAKFNLHRWNPGNCSFNIYNTISTSGNTYLVREGKLGDQLLSTAKAHGFHNMFAFFYTVPYLGAVDNTPEADAIKRAIRYAIARYGAYTDFWDITNETFSPNPPDSWLIMAASYIRAIDPYVRPVTNSIPRTTDPNFLDLHSPHLYNTWQIDFYPLTNKTTGLPVVVGEAGNGQPAPGWDPQSAFRMRIRDWTATFGGVGVVYWNTSFNRTCCNQYIGSEERGYNKVLHNFFADADNNMTPAQLGPAGAKGYSLTSSQTVRAYVFRDPGTTTSTTTSFAINVPFAGTASWIDPKTGTTLTTANVSSGNQTLTSPAFIEDIALKINSSTLPTPTPTPTPVPCTLTSASWSAATAVEGTSVGLDVAGTSCAGKTVSLEVRRFGSTPLDDIAANVQPSPIVLNAFGQGSGTWIAEFNPLIPGTNPDYYFKATVVGGNTIDNKTALLTVTQVVTPTPTPTPAPVSGTDWPQLQRDPQRTGYSPVQINPNYSLKWKWNTLNNASIRSSMRTQPVAAGGRVFFGSYDGKMYAIDTNTSGGNEAPTLWTYQTGAAIFNSAAADNPSTGSGPTVFFGSDDGYFYAVRADNGQLVWKYQTGAGIWTAPLVVNNTVYFGSRDGYFYALNQNNGSLVWRYDTKAPILNSAAYSAKQNTVYFGSENMNAYGLDAATGALKWQKKLYGQSFRDSWPVVHEGNSMVFFTTMPPYPHTDQLIAIGQQLFTTSLQTELTNLRQFYSSNPDRVTFFALDSVTGNDKFTQPLPVAYTAGSGGTFAAPVVNSQGEVLVVTKTGFNNYFVGGTPPNIGCCAALGKLDLTTGDVSILPVAPVGSTTMGSFRLIGDESSWLSLSGNRLIVSMSQSAGQIDVVSGANSHIIHEKEPTNDGFYYSTPLSIFGSTENPRYSTDKSYGHVAPPYAPAIVAGGVIIWRADGGALAGVGGQ